MDPELLELEVTEGAWQTSDSAVAVLSQLKVLGVNLSPDDFGTSYSALYSLKALPFDRVKIDRSFVQDIEHDRNAQALVRAILAMGESLGLALIAEGIETPRQLALLREYGCDEAQVFSIAKPRDAEQIVPLLSSKRHKPVLSVATRN